jgi:hypothetical protein
MIFVLLSYAFHGKRLHLVFLRNAAPHAVRPRDVTAGKTGMVAA